MPVIPPHHTRTLDNGLRVVAVDLPHLHTVQIAVFVKVGARHESPEHSGLSHFVEHMLFRGTVSHPSSLALNSAFESLGGPLHAETGRDYSLFQTAVEPDAVDPALALFAELLSRPTFDDIELERALILEELGEDFDEHGTEVGGDDIAHGLLFDGHPLGQRIIGPEANVRRFTESDVRAHFDAFYGAENAVLCLAGPVANDHLRAAARHMTALPRGAAAHAEPPVSHQREPLYRFVPESGSQSEVTLVTRAIPEADPDYPACTALLRAIDDGMSARLHYRLCDQLGLAYSLSAGLESYRDVSVVVVDGATSHGKVAPLIENLLELFAELRRAPVTAAELDRVVRRARFDVASAIDDPAAMASWFGAAVLHGEPPAIAARLDAIAALRPEDLQRVARRIFQPDRIATVVVGSLSRARRGEVRAAATAWR